MLCLGPTHGIFARAPQALNNTHVVQCHGSEKNLGRVGVAELEEQGAPWLVVFPYVRVDEYVKVVLEIQQGRRNRGRDKPDDQRPRDRRIRK